jgi:hypothetical protein
VTDRCLFILGTSRQRGIVRQYPAGDAHADALRSGVTRGYAADMPAIIKPNATFSGWIVACLCAQWCGTCREYRAAFDALCRTNPCDAYAWIDIEDDAEWTGELEVENFPTLLIAHGNTVHFFGTVPPYAETIARLIANARSGHIAAGLPVEDLRMLSSRLAVAFDERAPGPPP